MRDRTINNALVALLSRATCTTGRYPVAGAAGSSGPRTRMTTRQSTGGRADRRTCSGDPRQTDREPRVPEKFHAIVNQSDNLEKTTEDLGV